MDNPEGNELEDGEIVEYTPLERPVTYAAAPNSIVDHPNSDNDGNSCSDSESEDSDSPCFKPKRSKKQSEPNFAIEHHQKAQVKRKKYDIWCSELQESTLTDDLVNIDVANKNLDRSRNVESYDYSLAFRLHNNATEDITEDQSTPAGHPEPAYGNKRRFDERGSVKQRLGRRDSVTRSDTEHSAPRHLLALQCSVEDVEEDLASDIADKLCEQKEELILRVVQVLGKQKAIDLYEKTRKAEEVGGFMIMNGRRRRTPGGSYLFLLKMDCEIPQEKKQKVFQEDSQDPRLKQRKIRKKRKFNNFKKTLSSDQLTDVDLPTLLTRAEMAVAKAVEDDEREEGEAEATDKEDATNPPPPPSPATDGRDNSSDGEDRTAQLPFASRNFDGNRCTVNYDEDDDFLDVTCNSMDVF